MSNEPNKNTLPNEDPREAEPGRGAPGNNHAGVQFAQTVDVNPPDEHIPSGETAEESVEKVKAYKEQEKDTGVDTAAGFGITESGKLNNTAVEPEPYVEK
jgi:hypothetical protein